MAVRNLRFLGDDILLKPCKRIETVTDRIRILAEDMIETMRVSKGVGLAAPQVGILKRIMVVEVEEGNPIVFINPEITEKEGEQFGLEGCLSIPGKTGMVIRPQNIHVKAYDLDMKEFELDAQDLFARAICHECDHLDGKLYIDLVEGELMDSEADEDEQEEELQ